MWCENHYAIGDAKASSFCPFSCLQTEEIEKIIQRWITVFSKLNDSQICHLLHCNKLKFRQSWREWIIETTRHLRVQIFSSQALVEPITHEDSFSFMLLPQAEVNSKLLSQKSHQKLALKDVKTVTFLHNVRLENQ